MRPLPSAPPVPAPGLRNLPPAPAPAVPSGAELYRRLEAAANGALGNTGRRVLEDAYRRLRVAPGADLDPVSAGNLCDQFERAARIRATASRSPVPVEQPRPELAARRHRARDSEAKSLA